MYLKPHLPDISTKFYDLTFLISYNMGTSVLADRLDSLSENPYTFAPYVAHLFEIAPELLLVPYTGQCNYTPESCQMKLRVGM